MFFHHSSVSSPPSEAIADASHLPSPPSSPILLPPHIPFPTGVLPLSEVAREEAKRAKHVAANAKEIEVSDRVVFVLFISLQVWCCVDVVEVALLEGPV